MLGVHMLKGWSKTSSLIALSSGESEPYATRNASAETLGTLSMYKDFGVARGARVFGDASAALGIIGRQGAGKLRHIQTNHLWVQEQAELGLIHYKKVPGKQKSCTYAIGVWVWRFPARRQVSPLR